MSLMRSTCFWSAVISPTVRVTALVREVMVVRRGVRDYFGCTRRGFMETGELRLVIAERMTTVVIRSWSVLRKCRENCSGETR